MGRKIFVSYTPVKKLSAKTAYQIYFGYEREEFRKVLEALLALTEVVKDMPADSLAQFERQVRAFKERYHSPQWLASAISWASQRRMHVPIPEAIVPELIQEELALQFIKDLWEHHRKVFWKFLPLLSKYGCATKNMAWGMTLENEEIRQDLTENVLPVLQKVIPIKPADMPYVNVSFKSRQAFYKWLKAYMPHYYHRIKLKALCKALRRDVRKLLDLHSKSELHTQ